MSAESQKLSQSTLLSVRNNLAYVFRFGGVCTALKFNPSNISNEESRKLSSFIINSLNEELWESGVDVISTNYNNGGAGFMILTTIENKEQIRRLLEKLHISKTLKNEYVVLINDVLALSNSGKTIESDYTSTSYIMSIFDNYKINTQSQLSLSLNEDANTAADVQICERSIASQLQRFGLVSDNNDLGWLNIVDDFSGKFASNTKKYIVPGLLIVALFYTCQFLWKKYNELKNQIDGNVESAASGERALDVEVNAHQPFEPAQPSEPSDYSVVIGKRAVGNQRLSSLLKTLEDSDVKRSKSNNIESKILSLLAETTTSSH